MEGHAGHLDRRTVGLAARGQGDVEQAGRFFGILEKQLVEVAHAVEEQGVGMVFFQFEVLDHHGRMARKFRIDVDGAFLFTH